MYIKDLIEVCKNSESDYFGGMELQEIFIFFFMISAFSK